MRHEFMYWFLSGRVPEEPTHSPARKVVGFLIDICRRMTKLRGRARYLIAGLGRQKRLAKICGQINRLRTFRWRLAIRLYHGALWD